MDPRDLQVPAALRDLQVPKVAPVAGLRSARGDPWVRRVGSPQRATEVRSGRSAGTRRREQGVPSVRPGGRFRRCPGPPSARLAATTSTGSRWGRAPENATVSPEATTVRAVRRQPTPPPVRSPSSMRSARRPPRGDADRTGCRDATFPLRSTLHRVVKNAYAPVSTNSSEQSDRSVEHQRHRTVRCGIEHFDLDRRVREREVGAGRFRGGVHHQRTSRGLLADELVTQ